MVKKLRLSNSIFISLFLMSAVLLGLFFASSKLRAQSDPTQIQLDQAGCTANSSSTLKKCIEEARLNGGPIIKITSPIKCETRADCQFDLSNIPNGLLLQSTEQNKITRSNDYGYTLFTANNTQNLVISGLFIEDSDSMSCPSGVDCPAIFTTTNTNNLKFQNVTIQNSHGSGLTVSNSRDLSIVNSSFINSQKNGVEISGADGGIIRIENNRFTNNTGNGLIFQHQSDGSIIRANRFVANNAKGTYAQPSATCPFPCVASQLKINNPTSNLIVEKNVILGGNNTVFSNVGLFASGIELADRDTKKISLTCNEISSNRGAGIVQLRPVRNISDITIARNKFWQNGISINAPVTNIEENNCFDDRCQILECVQ